MRVRISGALIDWLVREDAAWSLEQAALLKKLRESPRRSRGETYVELDRREARDLKVWAVWCIHRVTPGKGGLGTERGLWNSATALVHNLDEGIADEDRRSDQGGELVAGDQG
jgi:hypothetical protein